MSYEGDLVRPLGLVTLFAAYAEGELDDLLSLLPADTPFNDRKRQWTIGNKLGYARGLVLAMNAPELEGLVGVLREGKTLFAQRNELVHGRLFSLDDMETSGGGGGRLVSNHTRIPERRVTAEEISALAERIQDWKSHLWMHRERHLRPLLDARSREARDATTEAPPRRQPM